MKDVSDVCACVVDTGLFLNTARRLAQDCKRVLYWNPEVRAFPSLRQGAIGDGFEGVEWVAEFWNHLDDIDLFVFPDVHLGELQLHLEGMGKPVWGARRGQMLELKREYFLGLIAELGLDVPDYKVCHGLADLSDWLQDKEDQYVKISKYRGDMETHHWRSWSMDSGWLDSLAVSLGPLASVMRFVVCPAIKTEIEIGGDTHGVDGLWPRVMLNGIEGKDKSYLSAVTERDEMPDQVQAVLAAFSPIFQAVRYRQQFSCEIRVKGEKFYFIDPTCRGGMPSTGSQQLLWKNYSEIIWAGANGEMVEPDPVAMFSIETMITCKREPGCWERVEIPGELEGTALFNTCCYQGGVYCFPPNDYEGNDLGWLVSIGDSPTEVLEKQKVMADLLPDGLNADVEALASVIKEVATVHQEGIPFTEKRMPEPAEVL